MFFWLRAVECAMELGVVMGTASVEPSLFLWAQKTTDCTDYEDLSGSCFQPGDTGHAEGVIS